MENISTSVCVENINFNLIFKNGDFFFDDNFKEFIKQEYQAEIFNSQLMTDFFSFNYNFISKNYSNKNIAFELQEKIIQSQKIPNKKGFIYLVTDGNFTKIGGTSYDVKKRLLELQTGNAKRLSILGYYKCEYLNITEKIIQNQFKDKNELNEWFRLDVNDCASILKNQFTFSLNEKIKTLSHISIINILFAQISLLKEYHTFKIKKYKRLSSKYILDRKFVLFITSEKIKKYNNNLIEKYIKKRFDYDFIKSQYDLVNQISKYQGEIIKVNGLIDLLNYDLLNYLDANNLEYNDNEDIWVECHDFENPLKYNNGIPYITKLSDIPMID
jgi:hypothetical protein